MMVERFTDYNNKLISKISESEKKLSMIIDNLPAATAYIIDNKINFNRSFINLFGYTASEIKDVDELINKIFLEKDDYNKKKFISSRNNCRIETPILSVLTKFSEIKVVEVTFQRAIDYEMILFKDVTTLKNKEQQLEASNYFIKNVAKALPHILYLFDLRSKKNIYTNNAVETLLGFSIAEIKMSYKSIYDLIHPEDLDSVRKYVTRVATTYTDDIFETEFRILNKEKKYIWLRNISKVFKRDENNLPSVVIGIAEDINEKKIATIRYTNTSDRLQMVTNEVNIGIWDWNINTNEFYWDETMYNLFESSRNSEPDPVKVFQSMVHPEDYDKAWIGIHEAYNIKERFETTYRIILPNKKVKFINTTFKVFKDEIGDPIRIMGVNQDVSEKRIQEIKLNNNNLLLTTINNAESLLFTEDNFSIVINNLLKRVGATLNFYTIKICRYTKESTDSNEFELKYKWKNKDYSNEPQYENIYFKLLNLDSIEALKNGQIIKLSKDEHWEDLLIDINIKSIQTAPIFVLGKFWGILALEDTKEDWAVIEEYTIINFANTLGGAIAQNVYKEELIIQIQKAEAAAKAKTDFLSIISHEIRTPLNAIMGLTDILLEAEQSQSNLENLNLLKFSIDNLIYLMNDILDFNKMDAGRETINEQPINLKEVLISIIESNNYLADKKQIQLIYEFDKNIPNELICDNIKLKQILNNLISNAINYTEKGFVKFSATLMRISKNDIQVEFSVEDSGMGIADNIKDKIFDFYSVSTHLKNNEKNGIGLGLAITSKLVNLLGGKIFVESSLNKGSKFYFTIPIKINNRAEKNYNTKTLSIKKYDLSKYNILVVEDNEINSLITTKYLESWGANVINANNGNEALTILKNYHVDLVLLDLFMPELDGYETTKSIRNLQNTIKAKTPIIAITASALKEVFDMAEKAGINEYMTKPFKPNELFEKIKKYL